MKNNLKFLMAATRMIKYYFGLFMLLISSTSYSAPIRVGDCEVNNLRAEFLGKGIVLGPKTTTENQYQGDVLLIFDYVCKAWDDRSNMRFGTFNLQNSYGGGAAFRSNVWGTVLQSRLALSNVHGDNNNIWIKTFNSTEVDSDGLLSGEFRMPLFYIDKNGTVSGKGENGLSFSAGSNVNYTTLNSFGILFSDGQYNERNIVSSFNLSIPVHVYDPTCNVSAPTTVNVDEIPLGQSRRQNFVINVSCADMVTVQSKILTTFTNSSSDVSLDSNGKILHYDKDNIKVDMSIYDENNNEVRFGVISEYNVKSPSEFTYNVNFDAEFNSIKGSSYGDFSFSINYLVSYN